MDISKQELRLAWSELLKRWASAGLTQPQLRLFEERLQQNITLLAERWDVLGYTSLDPVSQTLIQEVLRRRLQGFFPELVSPPQCTDADGEELVLGPLFAAFEPTQLLGLLKRRGVGKDLIREIAALLAHTPLEVQRGPLQSLLVEIVIQDLSLALERSGRHVLRPSLDALQVSRETLPQRRRMRRQRRRLYPARWSRCESQVKPTSLEELVSVWLAELHT